MENQNELIILIAEDDNGHAELIREGLEESGVNNKLIRFANGEDTWSFLSGIGEKGVRNNNSKYLLLLDINMPKMDGIEVLRKVKSDDELKGIPIIMLTTSDDSRDVETCYNIGCNLYISKPVDFSLFTKTLNSLGLFIQVITI